MTAMSSLIFVVYLTGCGSTPSQIPPNVLVKSEPAEYGTDWIPVQEETQPCSADAVTNQDQAGISYKNFRLGMSFYAFKEQVKQDGLPQLEKLKPTIKLRPGVSINNNGRPLIMHYHFLIAQEPLTIGGHTWSPDFMFVEENGVLRLAQIQGVITPPADVVMTALTQKYGPSPVRQGETTGLWEKNFRSIDRLSDYDTSRGYDYYEASLEHNPLVQRARAIRDSIKQAEEQQYEKLQQEIE